MLLVLVVCGSCVGGDQYEAGVQLDDQANNVTISLCYGLTLATLHQATGHVSGCHVNPAVTLGMVIARRVGVVKGVLYMMVQCLAGVWGAGILYYTVPHTMRGWSSLGVTVLGSGVTTIQALITETVITIILMITILSVTGDRSASIAADRSTSLAIGVAVTACQLYALPVTGASMNPARSLGPAVVTGVYTNHWVYWAGPGLGCVVGGVLYQAVLRVRPGVEDWRRREERSRRVECWGNNHQMRNDESPPYQKNSTEPHSCELYLNFDKLPSAVNDPNKVRENSAFFFFNMIYGSFSKSDKISSSPVKFSPI